MKAPDFTSTVIAGVVGAILFYAAAAIGIGYFAPTLGNEATQGYIAGAGISVSDVKQKIILTGFAFGAIVQIAVRLLGVS